ncbi:MAG: DUF72 domain-containing protein [Pirellulales bacterium]
MMPTDRVPSEPNSPLLPYHLGCPVWACPEWSGSIFRVNSPRREWLRQYSQAFNTVEGNSTFYAIPSLDTARRWAADTASGFRFALKFPQVISHERQLEACDTELRVFLEVVAILAAADRLGPTFLQLSASFGPDRLATLTRFLERLPAEFPYAVEVRHPAFFAAGDDEQALDELLAHRGVDRVLFDSRAIFDGPPADEHEAESQRRKPRVPLRRTVTGRRPLVRFVGRDDIERSRGMLVEWAPVVAGWIKNGLEPYFFTHAPCDAFAPAMAAMFHEALQAELPQLEQLPEPPGRKSSPTLRQRELF